MRAYYSANAEKLKAARRKDPSEYSPNYRQPPRKPAVVPECHPDRRHAGRGLCGACYQQAKRNGTLPSPSAECHPERPAIARGLCYQCYGQARYDQDPETARRLSRESQARARKRNRDEMVAAYGGKCTCPKCPETNPAFLTLEHVNGTGKEHRAQVGSHTYADLRRRGWPKEGYTLLCWNCNGMTRGGRTCPHMEAD